MYPSLPTDYMSCRVPHIAGVHSKSGEVFPQGLGGLLSRSVEMLDADPVAHQMWRESFYKIVDEITDGLVCIDTHGRFTYVSSGAEKILNVANARLVNHDVKEVFPEVSGSSFERAIRRTIETQTAHYVEDYYPPHFKWYRCKFLPDHGGATVIFSDVTSEKLAAWRRNQISAIVDGLPDAIILVDAEMKVIDWKGGAEALFRKTEDAARRIPLFSLVAFPPDLIEKMKDCMRTSQRLNINNIEVPRKDGSLVIVSGTFAPLGIEACSYNTFLLCVRDVTQGHRLYENLLEAKIQAEEANKSKSVFLANMSHEIRTPIAVILGYLQQLQRTSCDNASKQRMLALIEKNTSHLTSLLNDLLDLSALDSGAESARSDLINPHALVQDVTAIILPLAEARGLEFRVTVAESLNIDVKTDASKLRRILINLLNNAVKYTDEGTVELVAKLSARRELVFLVRDTGRGISRADQSIIFDMFSRCENARRIAQGAGLGLALSKKLAEVLGGSVKLLHSEIGVGSEFEFRCPCAEVESRELPAIRGKARDFTEGKRLETMKIHLIEDCPEIAELASYCLEHEGAKVTVSYNGAEALQKLMESAYDVVMLDYELPDMEAPQLIRQFRTFNSKTPVLAVTAHTQQDIFKRLDEVGVSNVLIKPYPMDSLIETLREMTGI